MKFYKLEAKIENGSDDSGRQFGESITLYQKISDDELQLIGYVDEAGETWTPPEFLVWEAKIIDRRAVHPVLRTGE